MDLPQVSSSGLAVAAMAVIVESMAKLLVGLKREVVAGAGAEAGGTVPRNYAIAMTFQFSVFLLDYL